MTKTYAQLAREIDALRAVAERQLAMEIKGEVAKINAIIAKYELTAADLTFKPTAASTAKKAMANPAGAASVRSSKAPFSDGKGNSWGGRGPRPKWLRAALAKGQTLESFATSDATPAVKGARPAPAKAKQAGVKIPAKYRDSTTGDTWSGRGSQPRWLKQALDKRGATLADFLIGASGTAAEKTAAGQRVAAKPVAKPDRTPKPAAKKSGAKKTSTKVVAPKAKAKAKATAKKTMASAKKRIVSAPSRKAKKPVSVPPVAGPFPDVLAAAAPG